MKLNEIKEPSFLKELTYSQLRKLATDIRSFLIENVTKTGGHLSSNLGVVELSIALHAMFNSPQDKIIFDMGHQSYVHKILTGRSSGFSRLRQFDGLSGYQNRSESNHDFWEAGHSGTSLSASLGCAIARDLKHEDAHVICVIGDESIGNGESFEALNHITSLKSKMIIILNDNSLSISKNVGSFTHTIARLRNAAPYTTLKTEMKDYLVKSKVGNVVLSGLRNVKESIKHNIIEPSIFTDLGLEYLGPIDGHSFNELFDALHSAKEQDGPVLIHVVTKKGQGFIHSDQEKSSHLSAISELDLESGSSNSNLPQGYLSYSQIVSETLVRLAKDDETICVLTPAMIHGSKLDKFFALYPNRSFDCNVAEEHAATLAASLALNGFKPFLSLYSTFLQRAYDQINHDIARMNCPVVIGVDRAGLVGEDGATHQGVFDIGLLRAIPNMIISMPKDATEAQHMLYSAFKDNHVQAIRYPRDIALYEEVEKFEYLPVGSWTLHGDLSTAKGILISYGPVVDKLIERSTFNKMKIVIVNARFIKPLDFKILNQLVKTNLPILCYESDMLAAGFGSSILEYFETKNIYPKFKRLGIADHFVHHGSLPELRQNEGIDINHVLEEMTRFMRKH